MEKTCSIMFLSRLADVHRNVSFQYKFVGEMQESEINYFILAVNASKYRI